MKVFYGKNRSEKDAPPDCAVYLDDAVTGRQERAELMFNHDKMAPYELFVVDRKDLGVGREVKAICDAIIERGGSVNIMDKPVAKPRGRPRLFNPDKAQDKKIKTLYHSYQARSYVLDRVEEIMGERCEWHQLKVRYGNRWKTKEGE